MNLIKICKKDFKNILNNKIKLLATAAVIIIPLLYSFFYLKAYWDPYGNLSNYSIAVVDKDKGTKIDGKDENYGNDVVNNLKKKNIGFKFVSEIEADEGLKDDKFFAAIIIPEDFSYRIATAKDGHASPPKVTYVSNNKKNYIGTKISEAIKNEFSKEVKKSISEEFGEVAFESIYDIKDGMKAASNGSVKLLDGTTQLSNNGLKLKEGLNELNGKVPSLQQGVSALSGGSVELNNGLGQLDEKVPKLWDGTNKLLDGSSNLNEGMAVLKEGANALCSKSDDLTSGGEKLSSEFDGKLVPSYAQLTDGLKNGADKLNEGSKQVQGGINTVASSLAENGSKLNGAKKNLEAYLESHPEAMSDPNMQAFLSNLNSISSELSSEDNLNNIQSLQLGAANMVQGTENLSNSLDINNSNSPTYLFYVGLNQFKNEGINNFTSYVNQYTGKVKELSLGLNKVYGGSSMLNGGLKDMQGSMPQLKDASTKLLDGSSKLSSGLLKLDEEVPNLSSGVVQITGGYSKLYDGINKVKDGSEDLTSGLTEGFKKIDDNVKTSSKDLGKFIGDPVDVKVNNLNPINNYGTGLAPYFLPISLWLGAVFMFLIIKSKNDNVDKLNNVQLVLVKFIPYGFIGIIQALMLVGVVLILGIKPSNTLMLSLFLVVMALSFDAIMQSLMNLFGLVGEGFAVVLLVLQLCSDAGTFPVETLPKFFQSISPYLPFTYCVEGLRELISATSINYSLVVRDAILVAVFGLVFMIINMIFIRKGQVVVEALEEKLAV